jgi:hypothetical protein
MNVTAHAEETQLAPTCIDGANLVAPLSSAVRQSLGRRPRASGCSQRRRIATIVRRGRDTANGVPLGVDSNTASQADWSGGPPSDGADAGTPGFGGRTFWPDTSARFHMTPPQLSRLPRVAEGLP